MGKDLVFLLLFFSILNECFGYDNWVYLIGIALIMSCSIYQLFLPKKSCIYALISRIPLTNTKMDSLRP